VQQCNNEAHVRPYGGYLPAGLSSSLAGLLAASHGLEDGSIINVFLRESLKVSYCVQEKDIPITVEKSNTGLPKYLRVITKELHHMNCPRFLENELIQRPIDQQPRGCHFVAFVDSKWVLDSRLSSKRHHIEQCLYSIRLQHCLRGVQGVEKLYGIVLSRKYKRVKSYLTELPVRGKLFDLMVREEKAGKLVSWARRQKWCKQIIEAVAKSHFRGFVVGTLGHGRSSCYQW
jgi:hypothetical protein